MHFVGRNGERRCTRASSCARAAAASASSSRCRACSPAARPGSPACAASNRTTAATCRFSDTRRRGPRQVQPAGRLDLGRRLALHRHARRALQPAARPVLPEHRLRALHPRHRAGRRLPRRPLVVGGRERQGMRPARRSRSRQRRSAGMNAPLSIEQAAARRSTTATSTGSRKKPSSSCARSPPRSSARRCCSRAARIRASCCAWPRRPSRRRVAGNDFKGRLPFPLLHVDTGHNFPEVIEFRDRRVAEMGERLVVGHLEDSIARGTRAPGAPARIAQRPPDRGAARSDRGTPLRRADRRRAPRRGEGARQGAHLQPPRQLRPMAAEGAAPRAVDAVQHPHQARASTSAPSRSATGPSSTCGCTSRARTSRCRACTTRTSAR